MERASVHNSFAGRAVGLRIGTKLGSRKWNRRPRRQTLARRGGGGERRGGRREAKEVNVRQRVKYTQNKFSTSIMQVCPFSCAADRAYIGN
jgi:hypothetical protein